MKAAVAYGDASEESSWGREGVDDGVSDDHCGGGGGGL